MGCFQRFCSELKRPMFDLDEPPMGRLDIRESFHMGEGLFSWVGIVKLIVVGIVVAAFVHAIVEFPESQWYPAYLTPWGVFFCVWYLVGSLLLTTSCGRSSSSTAAAAAAAAEQQEVINHFERPSFLVKFTWMVFSLACVFESCIVVLYWTMDYDPEKDPISLNNLNIHGIIMVITVLHGFLVDRVPVRIKHIVLTFVVGCVMCVWLAIQNVVLKYNPMHDDDDDALYDAMKWRENPTKSAILTAVVLFGAFPLFTIVMWLLSLPGRLYLVEILDGGSEGVILDYDKAILASPQSANNNADDADEEVAKC